MYYFIILTTFVNILNMSGSILEVENIDPLIPPGCNVVGEYRLACADVKELRIDSSNTANTIELYIRNCQSVSIIEYVKIYKLNIVNATEVTVEVMRKYLKTIWIDNVTSVHLRFEYQPTQREGKDMFLRNIKHLRFSWIGVDQRMHMKLSFVSVTLNRVQYFQPIFSLQVVARKFSLIDSHIVLKDRHDMTISVDLSGAIISTRIDVFEETELSVENSANFNMEDNVIDIKSSRFTSIAFKNTTAVYVKNNIIKNLGKKSMLFRYVQSCSIFQNTFQNTSIDFSIMTNNGFQFYNNSFELYECSMLEILRQMGKNANLMMNLRVVLQNNYFKNKCVGRLDQFLMIFENSNICENSTSFINASNLCEIYSDIGLQGVTSGHSYADVRAATENTQSMEIEILSHDKNSEFPKSKIDTTQSTTETILLKIQISTTTAPIWLAQTPLWAWLLLCISLLFLLCTVCICVAPSIMDCKWYPVTAENYTVN